MINEHREYFRIEERAVVEHKVVQDRSKNDLNGYFEANAQHDLLAQLRELDNAVPASLHAVVDGNADLAVYLRAMSRKIDLLANSVASLLDHENGDTREQTISLSEGGLAFSTADALPLDTLLALRVRLSSDALVLTSYAKVVKCTAEEDSDSAYTVAVEFVDLAEESRDLLAKHSIRMQQERARQAKANS
jgi:hypothetical protein